MTQSSIDRIDDTVAVQPAVTSNVQSSSVDAGTHQQVLQAAVGVAKSSSDIQMLNAVVSSAVTPPNTDDSLNPYSANASSASSNGALPFPFNPDSTNDPGLPDWFNDQIPSQYEYPFAYPGSDIISKLYAMINFINAYPQDKTAAATMLGYIANLETSGALAQYPQLMSLLTTNGINQDGQPPSLIETALDLLIDKNFFDGTTDPTTFFNDLYTAFGIDPNNPNASGLDALQQLVSTKLQGRQFFWNSWVEANTNADGSKKFTADQFNILGSGMWGGAIQNSAQSILQWEKTVRLQMVDSIMNNPMMHNNGLIAIMMIIFLLTDSSMSTDIGGYGATADYLKQRTDDVGNFTTTWTDATTDFGDANDPNGTNALNFINGLNSFKWMVDNSPVMGGANGSAGQIDESIQAIDGISYTYTNASGQKVTTTLGQLAASGDGKDLTEALAGFASQAGQPAAEYGVVSDNLKSLTNSISNQSQTVTTELSQLTQNLNQIDNILTKFLTDNSTGIAGLMQQIIGNFTKN